MIRYKKGELGVLNIIKLYISLQAVRREMERDSRVIGTKTKTSTRTVIEKNL